MESLIKKAQELKMPKMSKDLSDMSDEFENFVDQYLQLKEIVEELEDAITQTVKERFKEEKLDKIEGEKIVVQRIKNTKKKISDLDKAFEFVKTENKVDTAAVNEYLKENGKLPEGIIEVSYENKVRFGWRKSSSDGLA